MEQMSDIKLVKQLTKTRDQFNTEISKRVLGQQEIIDHILIALLCKGHTLLVGVPGLAKTLLIKSIAELLDLNFSRIQFTPDLMPSDITGTEIIEEDQKSGVNKNNLFDLYNYCKELNLNVIGLMCIPPFDENSEKYFKSINELNKSLGLENLSMGMSADYIEAIRNGSNFVRIGSSIFGSRS